ncbi:MAG: outer membrane beta-barrel protein [Bryobacteraceae bacterium]|nr:outer membrane beta-barrel protein [Bryobacteraceae bacterium]
MRHFLTFFLLACTTATGQIVSYGIKGGVPVTDAEQRPASFGNSFFGYLNTGRLTIGPTIEFHLPASFSIEVNALYRGYEAKSAGTLQFGSELNPVFMTMERDVRAWDFPLLLKYRFPGNKMRPFLSAGVSLTPESTDTTVLYRCVGPLACYPDELTAFTGGQFSHSRNREGYVGATGAEFRLPHIRIAPEVRYTRLQNPGANQVSVLVGISF